MKKILYIFLFMSLSIPAYGESLSELFPIATPNTDTQLSDAQVKTAYENNADTNAFTDAYNTVLGWITVTQNVNLDTIESDTATNNAKPTISSGEGAPSSTPTKVGDIYIDTTGDASYTAVGTASSVDWQKDNDGSGGNSWNPTVTIIDENTSLVTGDGFVGYNWVAPALYGPDVNYAFGTLGVIVSLGTVSTSGLPSFQIYNVTDSADILTTNITIDANEKNNLTATTAYAFGAGSLLVISPGDEFRFDCDANGTGAENFQMSFPVEEAP